MSHKGEVIRNHITMIVLVGVGATHITEVEVSSVGTDHDHPISIKASLAWTFMLHSKLLIGANIVTVIILAKTMVSQEWYILHFLAEVAILN